MWITPTSEKMKSSLRLPFHWILPRFFQIWNGKLTEQVENATTHEEEENAETEETAMSRHLLALLCHVDDNHCNFHDNVGRTYLRVSFHSICQSRITPPFPVFDIHLRFISHLRASQKTNWLHQHQQQVCSSPLGMLLWVDWMDVSLGRKRISARKENLLRLWSRLIGIGTVETGNSRFTPD